MQINPDIRDRFECHRDASAPTRTTNRKASFPPPEAPDQPEELKLFEISRTGGACGASLTISVADCDAGSGGRTWIGTTVDRSLLSAVLDQHLNDASRKDSVDAERGRYGELHQVLVTVNVSVLTSADALLRRERHPKRRSNLTYSTNVE